jgi:hypothetical protein
MSASHPEHPFTRAWEAWQAWSAADTWRQVLQRARQQGNTETVALLEQRPELLEGPDPLQALWANREVTEALVGWRWHAMRHARQQGHSWQEIATAVGLEVEQARQFYAAAVAGQRELAERDPQVGRYDPAWAELLADRPRAADREAGGER